jgi:hypothetical protein
VRESLGNFLKLVKPKGEMKVKAIIVWPRQDVVSSACTWAIALPGRLIVSFMGRGAPRAYTLGPER